MEEKINRFANLFFTILVVNALVYICDEALPAHVRLYRVTQNYKTLSFSEELKINKDLDFTLLLEDTLADDKELSVLLVEVDEATCKMAKPGDYCWVYLTPIFKHVRFCLHENSKVLRSESALNYRYPWSITHFMMPLLIMSMSIVGYKNQNFEVKFPMFLFATVFAVVQKWFLR